MTVPKVFFSYSREDAEFVLELAAELRSAGVDLWLDQIDIRPGEKWDRAVEAALESCECLVVVLSRTSVESTNVMDEVSFALETGKQLVPVLKEECRIPFRLRRVQHIDLSGERGSGFARLVEVLVGDSGAAHAAQEKWGAAPTRIPASKTSPKRLLAWGAGLVAALGVILWFTIDGRKVAGGPKWDAANWNPNETPAYVVVDTAYKTKAAARARVAALDPTYGNSGFLWIPDFDSLSGAQLFQVYVGPFRTRAQAQQATCEYIRRFEKNRSEHYAVLVSTRTTNQDRVFCKD